MALQAAQHEAVHNKTGSDLAKLKTVFDEGVHSSLVIDNPDDNPVLTSILYQMQKMQDELDYLRTEISANKNKTGITTSQANAITANTAKTSMTLGTTSTTALAGDTTTISTAQATAITANSKLSAKIKTASPANVSKSTVITFGELTAIAGKQTTYSLPITVVETTVGAKGNTTVTKTGAITLT